MNVTQISNTQALILAGVNVLSKIARDYQLDPRHPEYLGFINVSIDDMGDRSFAWSYICENPDIFIPIISKLGMSLEEGRLNLEETVFYVDKNIFYPRTK